MENCYSWKSFFWERNPRSENLNRGLSTRVCFLTNLEYAGLKKSLVLVLLLLRRLSHMMMFIWSLKKGDIVCGTAVSNSRDCSNRNMCAMVCMSVSPQNLYIELFISGINAFNKRGSRKLALLSTPRGWNEKVPPVKKQALGGQWTHQHLSLGLSSLQELWKIIVLLVSCQFVAFCHSSWMD